MEFIYYQYILISLIKCHCDLPRANTGHLFTTMQSLTPYIYSYRLQVGQA